MNQRSRIGTAFLFLFAGSSLRAQQINPMIPPPPPPPEEPAASAASTEPVFDPYRAGKSIEVGSFYMRKGDYDAAIDRFVEAARYQPNLAKPWKLMGEAYEKKHMRAKAIESYKKYLEVFPGAEDSAKIKKRISELEEKAGSRSSKAAPQ